LVTTRLSHPSPHKTSFQAKTGRVLKKNQQVTMGRVFFKKPTGNNGQSFKKTNQQATNQKPLPT